MDIVGNRIKAKSKVDAIGLFCPIPVVKLKLELEKVRVGEVVELLADDPGVCEDLPAWCKETNNKLLSLENREGIFVAYVERHETN